MDNSQKKLIAFITVFLLLFTTFAYSALSTSLTITANAKFRVLANIRVDDIGLKSTNNSLISYDSEYTKNTISSGFKLTSTSSSIDYNVVVNNNGNIDQVIYQISTVSSNNDGIIIYIDDEPMNDKLPYKIPIGTTNIKITYKTTSPSNQTINIVNQFDFRKLYSVDYNSKGGSQIASQDKIEDVDLTLTNNVPTKQGYTFAGWTDEENGTTAKFQAGSKYTLNKSIILYALYTRNTYNITYTLNGGTNDSNNPSTYNVESNDITLKDASKAGWTFTGWTGNGTTTPTKNLKLSKGSTGNKTFVAHFEKTITLTQKHGTTTTTQNYNLKDSETEHTFTLQNSVDSFPGWTFDGWLNDPTPKAKDYNPTGSITISTDKTVYATYKKELTTTFIDYTGITKQTRTVKGTAYGNNGCGGVGNQYPEVTSLTVSNYTDWTKLGWTNSTSASASVSLNSNTNYTLTEDKATTYYALYKQDVTLTYNSNGGSTKPSDEAKQRKVNSYSNTTYSHPTFTLKNTATKTGYTLSKWTISAPISADKNPTDSITIESGNSVTATAKWSANTYNISYTLNGGNNPSTKPASGTYDSNVQISNPTKTFTVNIDANSQGASIKNASGTAVTSASSTQTFAGWTSSVGTNAKTGTTTSDYVAWDGTSTTNTYFKNLTDTNNGTVTLTANWTAVNVTLPNITKTGYTCGYSTRSSGEAVYQSGGSYTPSTTIGGAELFAKCNANPYTVTYNGNGNTGGSTTSSSHTYDEAKTLTKNGFTKTGYVFAGWNTKANGTGTTYTDEQSVTNLATSGNVNLYAQWTANTYTVAYTMNGAAAKANQSVSYDSNLTLAKPTKTFTVNINANSQGATITSGGSVVTSASSTQTFAGWTGTNLSSTAVYGTTTSPSTSWNGTTKIGANDATIYLKNLRTTSGTVTLTANWTAVNVTLPKIEKSGYTCGYATSAGGNIAYQTGGSYTPSTTTGSVTLFAKCNANQYTVTYNGNGNTGGSTTASSHTYDEAKTLTKNGFTKTGYTFVGWNTKADGSGTNYEDEESVTNLATTGNFNLYAVWAPNTNTTYTVYHYIKDLGANTYSLNNTENKTGTSDASLTLANLKKTITGFTYSKGSLSGSTSGPGTVVTTTTIAADGTREIYLFYTRDTHTVTLTKGTGIARVKGAGTYEYGASVTINNTLNAGYSFVNWTVGTTSTAFATSQSKTFTMGTSDVTYKANGQLINYTITYNLNGGSVSTANPTTYNVTTDTFTLNNPTKTGYTFGGWTGSNGTTAQTSVSVAKGSTGNRTYTANYTAKTYTLTLKPNGGKYNNSTSDATKTMTYDSTNNNSIGTASKTGYTFTGWWTASSGGTQVYNANGQNVNASSYWTAAYNTGTWKYDGAVTLYAQFTKNDYSIAFNSNAPTGETATGTMANLAMKYDEAKNLTSNGYTISGYTFAGWNTKADGTGTAYLDGASVSNLATSGTVTLYAQWTVNTVTIGLQKDGSAYSNSGIKVTLYDGTTATSLTSTISSGSTVTFTKVPAKTYNIYVGEDTNHKTTMVDSNVDVVVNSSSTSQTVKFYTLTIGLSNTTTTVNGTSISNNGTVVVAEGYAHAVVAAANTGYEFVSNAVIWSNTGTMTIANTKASSTTVKLSSAGKLTSTATAKSYVVTAKANSGSIASTTGWTGTGTSATKSVTYKGTYGTLPSVSRTGYTLAGWNTKDDGTGTTVTASTTVNTASAHDIYAIWTPIVYHVTLNNQDATTSGTTDAYYRYSTVTNECYYYSNSNLSTCLSNGYNIVLPTKTGYTFGGYFTEENGGGTQYVNASGSFVNNIYLTVGDKTLYAKWTANTYTITYNGNNNTSGTTATSTHTYDVEKTLTANGFVRTGYTFGGWSTSASDKSLIIDDTEYHQDSTSITSSYKELKQYSLAGPFVSGEVYQLEFDAKGTGNLTTYFYGVSGYLQVSNVTNSDGWNGSGSDGNNNVVLTSNYKHYSVRFTLGSTGDGTKTKYVLLRAIKGNDCYAKNIRFFKVSSTSTAYTNEQSVKNLATTGNVNLYAMWLANELTFGNQTITKTFSTSSQTANVTAATNGTGTYTYSKVSGESDITVSSAGVITVPASKAANTTGYSVVIRATDSNSGKTKDATYTIKINKAANPLSVTASQTWSEAFSTSAKDKAITSSNGVGTLSYAIQSQKNTSGTTVTNFSISGSNLRRAASTPVSGSNYTVVVRVTAAGNDNYNSGYKDITYTVTVSKAACLMTLTNASMYTGATLDLTTKTSNAVGGVSYAIKTNGTTTASTLSGTNNKSLTAGAMNSANDTAQSVVITATEDASDNYNTCSKDMTVTVNKNANTLAANSKTVYVNSVNNYADIIKTNNGGALTASVTSDGTTGGSNDTTNKKYTAGVLSSSNDNNGSVVLSVTSARTTTVAEKTVSVTLTVQKYTNALSFVSPTPAANAALAYNASYTAKAQAETNGGTNGAITYSSGTTAAMTINSSSGAITVAKADGTTSVITASMARTTTVKAASITRTFSTTKGTCPAPTSLAISNAGIVTWTNASGASSYQISIDNTTFTAATSGVNYKSTITAATGTRTVYVRSVCSTTYYSAANSANASKSTTVYSVSLTKGTGIKSVSGAGNYITGATVTLGATADTGYTWSKWTQTTGGSEVSTTNAYSAAITGNWAYTANATANPYTVTAKANSGSIASTTGWTGTGTSATKSVTYKGTYGTLPSVSRTGYTLAGWNTKDDGTGTTITSSTTVNTPSAHDIYAIWVPSEISLADKTLSAGTYGTVYTSNAFDAATNGTGSYTYTLSNAPTGATINSTNRTISFTASTAAGTYNVTVTATDNETSKTDTATMTIVINKRNVTLTAGSTSRAWNNQALTNNTCTGNNLVSGHTVTCTMTSGSTITLAGSVDNVISTYSIKSGTTDLTSNYNVTTAKGTLAVTVATPTVTLTAKTDAQRTYTGSAIAANAATVSPNSTPTITYKYYTDSACSAGETTTAPTNAGTYYAKAYAAAVTNKTAAASSTCVNHSILKAAATNTIKITGTNTWGSTLTATITTNSDGAKGYQWYYSSTAGATSGGTAISGATSATYTIDKSLIGKYIYVVGTVGAGTNWNAATNSVDATDATTNTTQAVDKKTLSVTRTNYSAQYDAAAHGVIVKVNNSDWDGKTIVSGTSTSYGTTVTSTGAYNTNYTLSPTYTDYAASARTVYYKVTGGTYYKDYTGSGTVTISKKTATNTIKITGTNTWGSTLTATLTTNSNGTKSYKWYYSSTAGATSGGTAVGDTNCNTGSTCVIPQSLVGKYIYVVGSVGASTNYTTPADSVDATDATANGTQAVAKKTGTNSIKITGTNTWGSTLTATITTNSDGAKSYKWYYSSTAGATSGGTAVGATNCNTGSTCVIPNTLVGKYIYVVGSVGTSTYYTTPSDSVDATDATTNTTQAVAKKTCPAPTNVAIATDKKVTWTNVTGASSYQISIDGTTFAAHTNGAAYNSITAATGTRTVYVRSVCDTTYYSAANSANASKSTTVYSVTLTAGTGVSAVSGAGNYITGASVSIDATVKTGYTWTNWTGSSTITTKATSVTVNDNKSYTANATANTYTIEYDGAYDFDAPTSGTYDSDVIIPNPHVAHNCIFDANGQGVLITDAFGNPRKSILGILSFDGWTSSTVGSNAKTGTTANPTTAWSGASTTNTYFKNLKESGTVIMVPNWKSMEIFLPYVTKSGYLCGFSSSPTGNIEYYGGQSYEFNTGGETTFYAKCVKYDYTIAYTMNGGELPSSHPEGGLTNQDVYITNPTTKNVTINFNNTQGATIKNSSNQTITSMTSSQTFKGWASSSYQSNAKTGTTSNPTTSWTGSLTKNTYFKDLRNSGTIYMVANWNSSSITLPNATLSGRNCGYAPFDTSNIEYSNGQSYSVGTTLDSKTLYVRCLMAENLEYNTNLGSGSGLANTTFESLNNLDYYHEDAQYALDVIADFLK